ncbi:MAG: type II toxin-antitoxin system HicA family toxin [Ktedonobacterales bacterium]
MRELEADLRREGAVARPGKGSHRKYTHPLALGHVSISGNPGDDADKYQERDVRAFIARIREAKQRQKGQQP